MPDRAGICRSLVLRQKSVMELGSSNPVIVCADADVTKAATWQSQKHFGNCS